MHIERFALALTLTLATATTISACSSNGEIEQPSTFSGSGAGKSTGSGKGSGQGGAGTGGDVLATQSNGSGTASGGSGSGTGGSTCAATAMKATLIPVNLYIMLDKSGSMSQNNKWVDVTTALDTFFADPASAGLRVGLRFFPDTGCDGTTCDINACTSPAVPIVALTSAPAPADAQEANLITTVASRSPGGNTPMYAALAGAENYMGAIAAGHMGERNAVLLATDGEPNGCDPDINHIAQLAADALANYNVTTYTIGFQGSNQAQLDQIAMEGGTKMAFMIGNGNAAAQLVAALKAIQGSQVACDFAMPIGSQGMPIDPTLVNVDYTPGGGGMKQQFGQVANATACGPKGGWYYDDPAHPTKISLCPTTCQMVQADPSAEVDIAVGCQTISQPIN